MSADHEVLCWLHDEDDDHWINRADLVGVLLLDCGVIRYDAEPAQASRECAEALGQPERVVEWPAGGVR